MVFRPAPAAPPPSVVERAPGNHPRVRLHRRQLHPRDRPHGRACGNEQSRAGSRPVITINLTSVQQAARHNSTSTSPTASDLGDYDYDDHALSQGYAFSWPTEGDHHSQKAGVVIGQREKLGDGDLKAVF